MCRADVLVNVGNNNRFQLPSKLVDYVAASRPILNFVARPDDPSVIALRGYDAVLNVVGPFGTVDPDLLASVGNFVQAGALAPEGQRLRWLAQFELPAIIRAYEAELTPAT